MATLSIHIKALKSLDKSDCLRLVIHLLENITYGPFAVCQKWHQRYQTNVIAHLIHHLAIVKKSVMFHFPHQDDKNHKANPMMNQRLNNILGQCPLLQINLPIVVIFYTDRKSTRLNSSNVSI